MSKTTQNLLPCPFCGGEAKLKSIPPMAVVVCKDCGSMGRIVADDGGDCIEEAAELWNSRNNRICGECSRLFAIKLRAQRKKQGRSVDYMAKKLHMSKSTYYAFESGKMIPHDNDITLIANVLGIEPIKLTGRNIDESIQNYVRAYR